MNIPKEDKRLIIQRKGRGVGLKFNSSARKRDSSSTYVAASADIENNFGHILFIALFKWMKV